MVNIGLKAFLKDSHHSRLIVGAVPWLARDHTESGRESCQSGEETTTQEVINHGSAMGDFSEASIC